MIQATLGFIFNNDLSKVLLITKNRPEWQKGKINGVGGKIEKNETATDCISREIFEETDLLINKAAWVNVADLSFDTWKVFVFASIYLGKETDAKSQTDETVEWYAVNALPDNVMSNVRWLIPLSIDTLTNETPPKVQIQY